MVAGHSSTVSLLKTDTWLPKNALHTKERPRETNAQTMPIAHLIQKLKKLDLWVRGMETLLRRKWCKKLQETEWLMASLTHHIFSICTLKVCLQPMESKNFTKRPFLLLKSKPKQTNLPMNQKVLSKLRPLLPRKDLWSRWPKMLQTNRLLIMVSNGKIWITPSLY